LRFIGVVCFTGGVLLPERLYDPGDSALLPEAGIDMGTPPLGARWSPDAAIPGMTDRPPMDVMFPRRCTPGMTLPFGGGMPAFGSDACLNVCSAKSTGLNLGSHII